MPSMGYCDVKGLGADVFVAWSILPRLVSMEAIVAFNLERSAMTSSRL